MAKIFIQEMPTVLETSASIAVNGTLSSSLVCAGYSKLVGIVRSDASSTASGVRIQQSADYGQTWSYETLYTITACTASAFSIDVAGNAIRISASNGATAASLVRMWFALRPI